MNIKDKISKRRNYEIEYEIEVMELPETDENQAEGSGIGNWTAQGKALQHYKLSNPSTFAMGN